MFNEAEENSLSIRKDKDFNIESINTMHKELGEALNQNDIEKITDKILSLFKAAINCVPKYGGALASILEDFAKFGTSSKIEKLEEWAIEFNKLVQYRFNNFPSQLMQDVEYQFIFEKSIKLILANHKKEKLEMINNVLINSFYYKDYDKNKIEMYLDFIERLTINDILAFKEMKKITADAINYTPSEDYPVEQKSDDQIYQSFQEWEKNNKKSIYTFCFQKLESFGLLNTSFKEWDSDPNTYKMNEFGDEFYEFCISREKWHKTTIDI